MLTAAADCNTNRPVKGGVAGKAADKIRNGGRLQTQCMPVVDPDFEEFGFQAKSLPDLDDLDLPEPERVVLEKLAMSPVHVDDLAAQISAETPKVLSTLLALELKGLVKQLPGKYFVRGL